MGFLIRPVAILLALSTFVIGQDIGTELCSCAPNSYEFTLDFSLFCPPVNITLGDAVQATSCLVSPFGNPDVEDLVPVAVQSIDILELGQDLRVLVQENIEGNFGDGDMFSYTSIAVDPANVDAAVDIPRALQLNLVGVNANDEPIINVYIITFTNDCGTYPVLSEGQSAGWTRFSDLGPPDREFCPAAPAAPTDPATASPTIAPTIGLIPTDVPTSQTPAPSTAIASPSPTPLPTATPVTEPPLPVPTGVPTETPMSMSLDMSFSINLRMNDITDSMEEIDVFSEMEFGLPKRAADGNTGTKRGKSDKSAKSDKAEKKSSKGSKRR